MEQACSEMGFGYGDGSSSSEDEWALGLDEIPREMNETDDSDDEMQDLEKVDEFDSSYALKGKIGKGFAQASEKLSSWYSDLDEVEMPKVDPKPLQKETEKRK